MEWASLPDRHSTLSYSGCALRPFSVFVCHRFSLAMGETEPPCVGDAPGRYPHNI
jgi:hypothetical protein